MGQRHVAQSAHRGSVVARGARATHDSDQAWHRDADAGAAPTDSGGADDRFGRPAVWGPTDRWRGRRLSGSARPWHLRQLVEWLAEVPWARRFERLDETVALWRHLWTTP